MGKKHRNIRILFPKFLVLTTLDQPLVVRQDGTSILMIFSTAIRASEIAARSEPTFRVAEVENTLGMSAYLEHAPMPADVVWLNEKESGSKLLFQLKMPWDEFQHCLKRQAAQERKADLN